MGDHKNETRNGGSDWLIRNYDPATSDAPSVETELRRLSTLKDYSILDVDPMPCYDRFTAFAAHVFNCPAAKINLVDLGRCRCLSSFGLPSTLPRECSRQTSISSHVILARSGQLVLEDTMTDNRFASLPCVREHPFVRFYAGTSLISPEGYKIGTIAVMDWTPQSWTKQKGELLQDLAALVMDLMNERRLKAKRAVHVSETVDRVNPTFRSVCDSLSTLLADQKLQDSMTSTQKFTLSSALENLRAVPSANSETTTTQVHHRNGDRSPALGVVELAEFARNVELALACLESRRLPFWVDLHPSLPARAIFNDLVVFRATVALVTSALKRTREGFVCLRILPHSAEDNRPHIMLECEDTAPSITPQARARLFSPPSDPSDDSYCADDNCLLDGASGSYVAADIAAQLERMRPLSHGQGDEIGENPHLEHRSEQSDDLRLYPVAQYMQSVRGSYGCRQATDRKSEETGSILWLRIPIVLPDGDNA